MIKFKIMKGSAAAVRKNVLPDWIVGRDDTGSLLGVCQWVNKSIIVVLVSLSGER